MSEDRLLEKGKFYSIGEVASIAQCSTSLVLELGAQNKIPIYCPVPDDTEIYSTTTYILDAHNLLPAEKKHPNCPSFSFRMPRETPAEMHGIKFLRLSHSDCKWLLTLGEYDQFIFYSGIRFEDNFSTIEAHPTVIPYELAGNCIAPAEMVFACYRSQPTRFGHIQITKQPTKPKSIKLTIENLRIIGDLPSDIFPKTNPTSKHIPFDDEFFEMEYMSQRLVTLNKAAKHFWNPNTPRETEPTNEEVAQWIELNFPHGNEFGWTLANDSVAIIRDSYKNWDQNHYMEKKRRGELTKFDALVEVGKGWENPNPEEQDTYPKDITKTLQEKYGFSKNLAEIGAKILRPEYARIGGRPKKYEQ